MPRMAPTEIDTAPLTSQCALGVQLARDVGRLLALHQLKLSIARLMWDVEIGINGQ
jgi:hypothetical protein